MGTDGEVANAADCKSVIHGFKSHSVLQIFNRPLGLATEGMHMTGLTQKTNASTTANGRRAMAMCMCMCRENPSVGGDPGA